MRGISSSVSQGSRGTQVLCSLTLPKRLIQSWYLLRAMPIQGMKRATGMSVLSAQERTKSTSWSRVSWGTQGPGRVTQDFFEPIVELVGVEVEFIAQVGNRDLVDEVPFEDGDLLVIGKVTTRLVHEETSVQVILTPTERFSRFD